MARPLVIGLIGLAGVGKSTVAGIITKEYNFELVRLGDHVRHLLVARGLAPTPENERKIQTLIRQEQGMAALVKLSTLPIKTLVSQGSNILLDSMCSFSEKEYLREIANGCAINIVAVHAPTESRQLRLRERPQRPLSSEQMKQRDLLEIDQLEKGKLLALADHHLVNADVLETLEGDVRVLMQSIATNLRSDFQ